MNETLYRILVGLKVLQCRCDAIRGLLCVQKLACKDSPQERSTGSLNEAVKHSLLLITRLAVEVMVVYECTQSHRVKMVSDVFAGDFMQHTIGLRGHLCVGGKGYQAHLLRLIGHVD